MAGRFRRITLRRAELAEYRAAVIACAEDSEADACERLLGQLASLEALGLDDPGGTVSFAAAPGTNELARRALEELRRQPFRRRRTRAA